MGSRDRAPRSGQTTALLAELPGILGRCHTPIRGVPSFTHIVPVRAVRPLRCGVAMAVFDRIEMDVIKVSDEIGFVADHVIPEPGLPQLSGYTLLARHEMLEQPNTPGEIAVIQGHSPQQVAVVGHHRIGNGAEWMPLRHMGDCRTKHITNARFDKYRCTAARNQCQKHQRARPMISTIVHNTAPMVYNSLASNVGRIKRRPLQRILRCAWMHKWCGRQDAGSTRPRHVNIRVHRRRGSDNGLV